MKGNNDRRRIAVKTTKSRGGSSRKRTSSRGKAHDGERSQERIWGACSRGRGQCLDRKIGLVPQTIRGLFFMCKKDDPGGPPSKGQGDKAKSKVPSRSITHQDALTPSGASRTIDAKAKTMVLALCGATFYATFELARPKTIRPGFSGKHNTSTMNL